MIDIELILEYRVGYRLTVFLTDAYLYRWHIDVLADGAYQSVDGGKYAASLETTLEYGRRALSWWVDAKREVWTREA